jgi:hypothetical protein
VTEDVWGDEIPRVEPEAFFVPQASRALRRSSCHDEHRDHHGRPAQARSEDGSVKVYKLTNFLQQSAKYSRDLDAISSGSPPKILNRLKNRTLGRMLRPCLNRIWKRWI